MTIALIAHDSKKELMVQFCTAYCRILSQHKLVATGTTGKMIAEATGLQVQRFLAGIQGGDQQIASRIACNEVDLLLFFRDPINAKPSEPNEMTLLRLCDVHNIPLATNIATAEVLIHGLERGDLDWRDIVHPRTAEIKERGSGPNGPEPLVRFRAGSELELFGQVGKLIGREIAQRQDEPGQRLLRQSGQSGALVAGGIGGGQQVAHAVCIRLHPRMVAGGDVLDAQPVGSGQQGREAQIAGQRFFGQLACQLRSVQGDALDAEGLGRVLCSLHGVVGVGQADHCAHHGKALLLQDADGGPAASAAAQAHQDLILFFVGVEPAAGQKRIAHRPCLPPCA